MGSRPAVDRGARAKSRLNWRVTLAQFLVNAVVIGVLILVFPGFELNAENELLAVLWLAVVLGILSALLRPALEFLFLPYALQTFGLVVVLINAVLLALLNISSALAIDGILPLLGGAAVAGLVSTFLEGLLGLTPPVVDDAPERAQREGGAV